MFLLRENVGGPEKDRFVVVECVDCLSAEAVQSASLTLESVDDVHGGHRLALGVLSVRDSVTNHVLQEDFENASSLLVDETRDTLDTTSASETTDGWLRDALDVVTKYLAMTLGATLAKSFTTFATSRHIQIETNAIFTRTNEFFRNFSLI